MSLSRKSCDKWENACSPHGAAPLHLALQAPWPRTPQSLPVPPPKLWRARTQYFPKCFLQNSCTIYWALRSTPPAKSFHDRAECPSPGKCFLHFLEKESENQKVYQFPQSHISSKRGNEGPSQLWLWLELSTTRKTCLKTKEWSRCPLKFPLELCCA